MMDLAKRKSGTRSVPLSLSRSTPLLAPQPLLRGPPLTVLVRAAITLFIVGASVGAAAAYANVPNLYSLIVSNVLATNDRRIFLNWAGASGVGVLACSSIVLLRHRNARGVAILAFISDVASPLMLAFALPLLFRPDLFLANELLFVVSCTIFGLLLERTLRRSLGALESQSIVPAHLMSRARLPNWVFLSAVIGLALFFGVYFSYYTILHHYQLQTRSFDLGIFDNMMWNLLRGAWFKAAPVLGRTGSHLRYHATFDAYLLAPIYALRQKADTLLALQALLVGAGAIPICLLAKRRLGNSFYAWLLGYAYVIHAPLHGPVFYDFHFLTLAPFFVSWVLYFFETRRNGWLFASWIAAVLLREELSAGLAAACLFYLLCGRRPVLALWGGVASAACFLIIKFIIMPASSPSHTEQGYAFLFAGLIPAGENGFGAVLRTVGSNPIFTLNTLLTPEKLAYVMKTLGPVLLLPLRNARAWVLLLPAAIFTLLSTGAGPVTQTYFQYTSNWTAYLFFAVAVTLAEWKTKPDGDNRVTAAMMSLAVTATAMSYNFGAIFQHSHFRGGFSEVTFRWGPDYRASLDDLYSLIAMIPKDASVAATETEVPHVSNRADCFTMRATMDDPDYLLANLDEVNAPSEARDKMLAAIRTEAYGFIAVRSRFALWGKNQPHDKDIEGKGLLHLTE